jgi:arylsulfatase B
MLSAMDDAIGRVLEALEKAKLDEDTLVVFFSDNGGPTRANASRNDPLRGGKGTMYEGGIRVPFAVRFKGRLPAGSVYEKPVISLDVLPTAAAAAGAKLPDRIALDGVDLLPHLLGETKGRPHETLCWRMGDRFAIRHGDLKLLKDKGRELELYDLAADVSESKDLAGERRADVTKLGQRYVRWEKGTVEPRWPKPVRGGKKKRRRR